jgi:hypothetical protein
MGYALMWIEALVAAFFFSALFMRRPATPPVNFLRQWSRRKMLMVFGGVVLVSVALAALKEDMAIIYACLHITGLTLFMILMRRCDWAFNGAIFLYRLFGTLLPLLSLIALVYVTAMLKYSLQLDHNWFEYTLSLAVLSTLSIIWLIYHYFRGSNPRPAMLCWSTGRLALAFAVSAGLLIATFMSVDAAVKTRMDALAAEARSQMSSLSPRVPDRDNAAMFYEKAFEAAPKYQELPQEQQLLMTQMLREDFNPRSQAVRDYLSANAALLHYVRQATTLPDCYFERELSPETLVPELGKFRQCARVLALDALHRASLGDLKGALADIETINTVADHAGQSPFLISGLVSIAVESIGKTALETILRSNTPGAADLDQLKQPERLSFRHRLQRVISHENLMCAASLSLMCHNSELFFGSDDPVKSLGAQLGVSSLFRVFFYENELATYQENLKAVKNRLIHASVGEANLLPSNPSRKGLIDAFVVSPIYDGAIVSATRADASRRLVRLALAMCRHRARHGQYPDKLDALAPDFLPCLPIDPFDGKPLKMARKGNEIWLYSAGEDNKPLPEKMQFSGDIESWRVFRMPLAPQAATDAPK